MRQSLQMVLEDAVDCVDMIEDAQHERRVFIAQLIELPAHGVIQAAVGPLLDGEQLRVGWVRHDVAPCLARLASNSRHA
jgi:hypothetical protein